MIFVFLSTILLVATSVYGLPARRAHSQYEHANRRSPATTASGGTSGCGTASAWKFDAHSHSNVTMGDRSFLVHIPPTYDTVTPHPVVLSFHAFKNNDLKQEKISGFSQKGLTLNGKGIIAVYPAGHHGPGKGKGDFRAWQGAPYSPPGIDDIAFTQKMVQQLKSNLCIDSKRMYASGKSNGGGFTNLLACTPATASMFAAFAPVSAALYSEANPENCDPGRAVPIINFHGLADKIVPFDGQRADKRGDTAYATPNITKWREGWALRNGCRPHHTLSTLSPNSSSPASLSSPIAPLMNAIVSHPDKDTTLKQFDCSASNNDAVVNGFTVKGLGHSWPSTAGLDGGFTDFNATTTYILPFFERYALD